MDWRLLLLCLIVGLSYGAEDCAAFGLQPYPLDDGVKYSYAQHWCVDPQNSDQAKCATKPGMFLPLCERRQPTPVLEEPVTQTVTLQTPVGPIEMEVTLSPRGPKLQVKDAHVIPERLELHQTLFRRSDPDGVETFRHIFVWSDEPLAEHSAPCQVQLPDEFHQKLLQYDFPPSASAPTAEKVLHLFPWNHTFEAAAGPAAPPPFPVINRDATSHEAAQKAVADRLATAQRLLTTQDRTNSSWRRFQAEVAAWSRYMLEVLEQRLTVRSARVLYRLFETSANLSQPLQKETMFIRLRAFRDAFVNQGNATQKELAALTLESDILDTNSSKSLALLKLYVEQEVWNARDALVRVYTVRRDWEGLLHLLLVERLAAAQWELVAMLWNTSSITPLEDSLCQLFDPPTLLRMYTQKGQFKTQWLMHGRIPRIHGTQRNLTAWQRLAELVEQVMQEGDCQAALHLTDLLLFHQAVKEQGAGADLIPEINKLVEQSNRSRSELYQRVVAHAKYRDLWFNGRDKCQTAIYAHLWAHIREDDVWTSDSEDRAMSVISFLDPEWAEYLRWHKLLQQAEDNVMYWDGAGTADGGALLRHLIFQAPNVTELVPRDSVVWNARPLLHLSRAEDLEWQFLAAKAGRSQERQQLLTLMEQEYPPEAGAAVRELWSWSDALQAE